MYSNKKYKNGVFKEEDHHDSKKTDHDESHGSESFMVPDSSVYIRPEFIPSQR